MVSVLVGAEHHTLVLADNRRTMLDVQIGFACSLHYINNIAVCQAERL